MNDQITAYARANDIDNYNAAKRAIMADYGNGGSDSQDGMMADLVLTADTWNERMIEAASA